ncbi:hypothetical protein ACNISO_26040, partial [Escherichia coli]
LRKQNAPFHAHVGLGHTKGKKGVGEQHGSKKNLKKKKTCLVNNPNKNISITCPLPFISKTNTTHTCPRQGFV